LYNVKEGEYLGMDKRIILKLILKERYWEEVVGWIHLVQDRDQLWAFVTL
jgi:hypothetical protein